MYVLKTTEELPENYEIERLPDITIPKTGKIAALFSLFILIF